MHYRSWLKTEQRVFADVHVKHGSHAIVADRSLEELTRDLDFFGADAVIVTGQRTGDAAQMAELSRVADATRLPVLIGSGVTVDNVGDMLSVADGVIVASSLKEEGVWWEQVAEAKINKFMQVVAALL